jgi:hypothetical protein
MQSLTDTFTTLIALALAAMAAVMSAPGHAVPSWQLSDWLQMSICPEADAMAGAIGEHPPTTQPP